MKIIFSVYVEKIEEIRPIRVLRVGENRAGTYHFKKVSSRGQQ
jgi:hypothetical protein